MILNIVLAIAITGFTGFEINYIKNEYKQSREKKDLFRIIIHTMVLCIALAIMIYSVIFFNKEIDL